MCAPLLHPALDPTVALHAYKFAVFFGLFFLSSHNVSGILLTLPFLLQCFFISLDHIPIRGHGEPQTLSKKKKINNFAKDFSRIHGYLAAQL